MDRPDTRQRSPRPEQRISLSFDVFAVSQRLGAYLERAMADAGLRPAEYAVYSLMLEAGPRTPSQLAAMLGVPPSTLSTYLTAMLARGDARRIPNPSDGRSVQVVLTDRGRAAHRRANRPFSRAQEILEANLDRPVEEVRVLLIALGDSIARASDELADEPATATPLGDTSSS